MWPEGGQHLSQPITPGSKHHPGTVGLRSLHLSSMPWYVSLVTLLTAPNCQSRLEGPRYQPQQGTPASWRIVKTIAMPAISDRRPNTLAHCILLLELPRTHRSHPTCFAYMGKRQSESIPIVIPHGQQVPTTADAEQFTHMHSFCAALERPCPLPLEYKYNSGLAKCHGPTRFKKKKTEEHSLSLKQKDIPTQGDKAAQACGGKDLQAQAHSFLLLLFIN